MPYSSAKNAYGISDRSGFRYKLKDMKKEWTGALVGPDEYEKKHPQLTPRRFPTESQSLRDPRPDQPEDLTVYAGVPTVEAPKLERLSAVVTVGQVEVTTS